MLEHKSFKNAFIIITLLSLYAMIPFPTPKFKSDFGIKPSKDIVFFRIYLNLALNSNKKNKLRVICFPLYFWSWSIHEFFIAVTASIGLDGESLWKKSQAHSLQVTKLHFSCGLRCVEWQRAGLASYSAHHRTETVENSSQLEEDYGSVPLCRIRDRLWVCLK